MNSVAQLTEAHVELQHKYEELKRNSDNIHLDACTPPLASPAISAEAAQIGSSKSSSNSSVQPASEVVAEPENKVS
jgi:hypothetical protein